MPSEIVHSGDRGFPMAKPAVITFRWPLMNTFLNPKLKDVNHGYLICVVVELWSAETGPPVSAKLAVVITDIIIRSANANALDFVSK
jgi:hypothetical protein